MCVFDLNIVVIMASLTVLGVIGLTKIIPKYSQNEANTYKKMKKLDQEYIKKLEDEIEFLESEVKSLNGSMNRQQKGFKVEGDPNQWSSLLPEIFENFGTLAPKWLQPFMKNKDIQSLIMSKVQENPEKYVNMFTKFIGKKEENETSKANPETLAL